MTIAVYSLLQVVLAAPAFQASLGLEPALMPKVRAFEAIFLPYGAYYFNNRVSLKMGAEFGNFFSLRGTFGLARSFMRDGPSCISQYDGSTGWRSFEASFGIESGYAARYRRGKGDVIWGISGILGHFDGVFVSGRIGSNDSIYYDSASIKALAKGGEVYLGLNLPIGRLGPIGVKIATILKGGALFLDPTSIGGGYEWKGYPTKTGTMPRWGVSVALNFDFDASKIPLDVLPDARWRHKLDLYDAPLSQGCLDCCCLYGTAWPVRGRGSPLAVQILSALVMGPGAGTAAGLLAAASMWDASSEDVYKPVLGVCFYLFPPVGSVLGTMGSGAIVNPGGSFRYTLAGALFGTLANLALTEGYILVTGRYPWTSHWPPLSVSLTPDVIGVMIAGSTLPAVGAVIGYNLSIKHTLESSQDTLGLRPSWTEFALEQSRETGLKSNTAVIGFDIIDLSF